MPLSAGLEVILSLDDDPVSLESLSIITAGSVGFPPEPFSVNQEIFVPEVLKFPWKPIVVMAPAAMLAS